MKTKLIFAMCILIMAGLVACSRKPVNPNSISSDDTNTQQAVRWSNVKDDVYAKSLNHFSYSTISKILSGQSKNVNYSPISLYLALALAGTGANGATQDEIFSTLGVSGKGKDFLSIQSSNLISLLSSYNNISKLKIANSIWLQKNVKFKEAYKADAAKNFYASLFSVDFSDDRTSGQMSKWISENTNGILSPKMSLNKEQIMSIINTIYFKDEWVDRFDQADTKMDTFHLGDGSKIKCDFMNMTYIMHEYIKGNGFTSSSLSLKNSGSMIFILPDKGVSIDDLISTPQKVAELFNIENSEHGKVIFQIPKFSFGSDLALDDTLKSLGIVSAFKPNADFTGITDHIAFISSLKQQSHIAIDEKGVEAAAFTQVFYSGSAGPNDKVVEMILDRPFIYVIKSKQNDILFIGVVNNPTDK